MVKLFLVTLATLSLWAGGVAAQPASGQQGRNSRIPTVATILDACQADLKTHCGDVPFQIGRVSQCLRRNGDKLSQGCQSFVAGQRRRFQADQAAVQPARDAARQACEADVKSFCANDQGRRLSRCLRTNEEKLSEGCRTARADLRRAYQERRRAD